MEIIRRVEYMQAANCRLVVHVGCTAFVWGTGSGGYAARIEIFTPLHWFRFRRRIGDALSDECRERASYLKAMEPEGLSTIERQCMETLVKAAKVLRQQERRR